VKAKAFKAGYLPKRHGGGTYTLLEHVATPEMQPGARQVLPLVGLTIACATTGAVIRYTTDGSDPTESSTAYTAPIL